MGDRHPGCGDNSCEINSTPRGMSTNGGCRCFDLVPHTEARALRREFRRVRGARDALKVELATALEEKSKVISCGSFAFQEIDALQRKIDRLEAEVKDLQEYKAMYEGLCK